MQSEVLALETDRWTWPREPSGRQHQELTAHVVERVQTLSRDLKRVVPWLFPPSPSRTTCQIMSPADLREGARTLAEPASATFSATVSQVMPLPQKRRDGQSARPMTP